MNSSPGGSRNSRPSRARPSAGTTTKHRPSARGVSTSGPLSRRSPTLTHALSPNISAATVGPGDRASGMQSRGRAYVQRDLVCDVNPQAQALASQVRPRIAAGCGGRVDRGCFESRGTQELESEYRLLVLDRLGRAVIERRAVDGRID
jgi:hypothetical protein